MAGERKLPAVGKVISGTAPAIFGGTTVFVMK